MRNRATRTGLCIAVVWTAALACSASAQEFEVRLWSRTLSGGIDPDLVTALQDPARQRIHAVLRFREPLSLAQHRALRDEGIRLLSYLQNNGYFASLPAGTRPGEGALAGLGGADLLRPEDKRDRRHVARPAGWYVRGPDLFAFLVEIFPDVTPDEAGAVVGRVSPRAVRYGPRTWSAELSPEAIERLAREDRVKRLVPGPAPRLPLTEMQRVLTRSDEAQQADLSPPRPVYRVDGAPVRIGICDWGVDERHADFRDLMEDGSLGVLRIDPHSAEVGSHGSMHGTWVASIAASSGYGSSTDFVGPFKRRGHAPYVHLGDFPTFGVQIDAIHDALVELGMHVTNHSYAQSLDSRYDGEAAAIDAIVRGDEVYEGVSIPPRPQVWAAGNNGTHPEWGGTQAGYHSLHATAKNSIAVGSVNAPHDDLSSFSSLGPTFDGRIKPDLVAPGWREPAGVVAAKVGSQGYSHAPGGTSMAAPVVSGILALMMHQYQRTHETLPELLPSTYKAMLVHTATDLDQSGEERDAEQFVNSDTGEPVRFGEGPDFATGWGRVDAEASRQIIDRDGQWREGQIESTGDTQEYCLDVPVGSGELKATLAWDDRPGEVTLQTESKLVNDLDLLLEGPAGITVLPWTIDPLPLTETIEGGVEETFTKSDIQPAHRAADHRNNVEMANDSHPAAGTWRIKVIGHSLPLPLEGAQKYSLVTSHPISEACP